MNEFDIYTLGSGYYLEKIFNALRFIIDGTDEKDKSFIYLMKFAAILAIVMLAVRAGFASDFKGAIKWFLSVSILVAMFLTTRATVRIHDNLPDSYGMTPAARVVKDVPWGLAVLGSVTSTIGNSVAEKFNMAFSGVFVNSQYQQTGMLFGSKIVEDTSKIRISDASSKRLILDFYKKCIVPDLAMGTTRKNGYTVKDLVNTDDIIKLLKERSSNARMMYVSGSIKVIKEHNGIFGNRSTLEEREANQYMSCNQVAHYIGNMVDYDITTRFSGLASSFMSYFFPDQNTEDKEKVFKSVLESSYGNFLRKSSKEAKDILLQNVMINTIDDTVDSYGRAYGKVTTEEMTNSAFYSVSQMAQKFVPILRAVLECTFYGVFPLILILMVTPIGLEVLKNYGFSFIYLQLWQPMYAILFCIAGAWGKHYAAGIDGVTFASHFKIMRINEEISAIAGYMLVMVPVLSLFVTKGLVSSMGSLASSIFYIPQSAAVSQAQRGIEGNYQLGTTSIDTHSFNNTNGNKYDDNYAWMSGMKSFSMASGALTQLHANGRTSINSRDAINNIGGLANIDLNKSIGSRFDQGINEHINQINRHSSNMVTSTAAGYSKLLGWNEDFSQNSTAYQNWTNTLSVDQRAALDEVRSWVDSQSKNSGITQKAALEMATGGGISIPQIFPIQTHAGSTMNNSFSRESTVSNTATTSENKNLTESLNKVKNLAYGSAVQKGDTVTENMLNSAKSDFSAATTASLEKSKAFEELRALQESKSIYEQNSAAITQNLSHQFIELGIERFGAERFEEITRNNPVLTNQLLNEYLDKNVIGNAAYADTAKQIAAKEAELRREGNNSITDDNNKNLKVLNQTNKSNEDKIKNEAPKEFIDSVRNKVDGSKVKAEVTTGIENATAQISQKKLEKENKQID